MNHLSTRELIRLMQSVPVSGPLLDVKLIPEPIRSEMLSGLDFHLIEFPDGPGSLCVYSTFFAFWCGFRLSENFNINSHKVFSDDFIESLNVKRTPPRPEPRPTAIFKPGAFIVNLISNSGDGILGRVVFGKPYQDRFELRHHEWICTSLVISEYANDEQQVVYTKSGSDYRLEHPFNEVDRPIDMLPWLRKGFGPNNMKLVNSLKYMGINIIDIIN